MVKETALFTVAEVDQQKELISVAEEDYQYEIKPDNRIVPPSIEPVPGQTPVEPLPVKNPPAEQEATDTNWRTTKDTKHFPQFLLEEIRRMPTPAAIRSNRAEMERALGQYGKLNKHISQALREDYDGVLDAKQIDKARQMIEHYIDDLETMLEGLDQLGKNRKKLRRRGEDESDELIKEAGTPHFTGIQVQLTSFERALVGSLINGVVAGGKNMEELYDAAKKKYKLTPREELAVFQILTDFGYPTFKDRLRIDEKDLDPTESNETGEWPAQYYG